MKTYIIGSDKVTVDLAARLVKRITDAIAASQFSEAERLIAVGCNAVNRPFRSEFLHQSQQGE